MKIWYKKNGINNHYHFPIADIDEEIYIENLYQGALLIHDLVDTQGLKLYLHCTTGVSRGPTLLLVYFALFCKHPNYSNFDSLYSYLEEMYIWQDANINIARVVIEKYKIF
jgi:hypothetical protein